MHEFPRNLENALGPGTTDFAIRVGLHSKPVAAGVLRREKARFLLFRDTMNTAVRNFMIQWELIDFLAWITNFDLLFTGENGKYQTKESHSSFLRYCRSHSKCQGITLGEPKRWSSESQG